MNRGLLDPPTAPRIIVGAIDRSSWRKCLLRVLPTVAGAAAAAAIAPPSRRSLLLQQVQFARARLPIHTSSLPVSRPSPHSPPSTLFFPPSPILLRHIRRPLSFLTLRRDSAPVCLLYKPILILFIDIISTPATILRDRSTRHVSPAPNESLLSRLLRSTLTDSRQTRSEQSPLGCLDAHIATTPTTRL
ncbi:hypothetical protein CGCSCA5_v013300 [Colletotrichum siamense]|nr:hypothetical protein CGCSCA5_v013300 [Colletotrichum siamense]